jgi:hypothetical protein
LNAARQTSSSICFRFRGPDAKTLNSKNQDIKLTTNKIFLGGIKLKISETVSNKLQAGYTILMILEILFLHQLQ